MKLGSRVDPSEYYEVAVDDVLGIQGAPFVVATTSSKSSKRVAPSSLLCLLGEEWEPEPSAADRLPEVQGPTLLIVGDEDQPRVFAAADLLEKELPNVRKAIMHGTAHMPNMERPEGFKRIVLDFLQDFR